MRTPLHGMHPPFQLPSNVVYFHDWRYVHTGDYHWRDAEGNAVPMWGIGPVPDMRYPYSHMPLGISLRCIPANKTEPVFRAGCTTDSRLFGGSVIREDGRYRLWHMSWPRSHIEKGTANWSDALCYAESDDGVTWKRPRVVPDKVKDCEQPNFVYGGELAPYGFHGASVFRDPSAPARERYKCFHLGFISPAVTARYRSKWPNDVDPFAVAGLDGKRKASHALCGAVSPDGIRWTPRREPLLIQTSDTQNICEYDSRLGQYVAYCRSWVMGRRTIARTTSDDFRHFSFPEEVFWPGPSEKPYSTWYANAKTVMPDAPDYHLMFPMRWDLTTDAFQFHLAVSPDNVNWHFVPGGPVGTPGQTGDWDGGTVAPGHGLVALPGNLMGILYCGTATPHKYPRRAPYGDLAWATWQTGRIAALHCPEEGAFSLFPLVFEGRTVRLNMHTRMTGYIRVEALDEDGAVLPGRSFEDCDHLSGNDLNRLVTWRGESDLGHTDARPVQICFRLRNAELYSVAFKPS